MASQDGNSSGRLFSSSAKLLLAGIPLCIAACAIIGSIAWIFWGIGPSPPYRELLALRWSATESKDEGARKDHIDNLVGMGDHAVNAICDEVEAGTDDDVMWPLYVEIIRRGGAQSRGVVSHRVRELSKSHDHTVLRQIAVGALLVEAAGDFAALKQWYAALLKFWETEKSTSPADKYVRRVDRYLERRYGDAPLMYSYRRDDNGSEVRVKNQAFVDWLESKGETKTGQDEKGTAPNGT